jgi:calcineurin-like phosphoesterase family protein
MTFTTHWLENLSMPDPEHGNRPRARNIDIWKSIPIIKGIDLSQVDRILIWSDTHYYHNNIIQYSDRPFADVEEMNSALDANYRSVVKDTDVAIWCGDVAFGHHEEMVNRIASLPGYKIHIVGNHDIDRKGKLIKYPFDEVHSHLEFGYNGVTVQLTHHPMTCQFPNTVNVHGHIHQHTANDWNKNVSVERINYTPVLLADIIK